MYVLVPYAFVHLYCGTVMQWEYARMYQDACTSTNALGIRHQHHTDVQLTCTNELQSICLMCVHLAVIFLSTARPQLLCGKRVHLLTQILVFPRGVTRGDRVNVLPPPRNPEKFAKDGEQRSHFSQQ